MKLFKIDSLGISHHHPNSTHSPVLPQLLSNLITSTLPKNKKKNKIKTTNKKGKKSYQPVWAAPASLLTAASLMPSQLLSLQFFQACASPPVGLSCLTITS